MVPAALRPATRVTVASPFDAELVAFVLLVVPVATGEGGDAVDAATACTLAPGATLFVPSTISLSPAFRPCVTSHWLPMARSVVT